MINGFNFRLSIASVVILVALALHFFVSISLPFLTPWYIVETSFDSNSTKENVTIGSIQQLTQIRLGIWGACYYSLNGSTCSKAGSGYDVTVTENKSQITVVQSSWTGGLPVQVFSTGCTFIAFLLTHLFFRRYRLATVATLVAVGLAGSASALAVLIDLALFGFVKGRMQTLGGGAGVTTDLGPGFWMTIVSTLLLIAGFLRLFFTKEKPFYEKPAKEHKKQSDEISMMEPQNPMLAYNHQPFRPGFPRPGFFSGPFTIPHPFTIPQPFNKPTEQMRMQSLQETDPSQTRHGEPTYVQSAPNSIALPHGTDLELNQGTFDRNRIDQTSQATIEVPPPAYDGR